jgi:hypothetical protein
VVRVGNNTSATLISIQGPLRGVCSVPSCTPCSPTIACTIIKFADNTTGLGLITDNDETAYKEKVRDLAVWCQDNNLSLINKLIVDYRKRRAEHAPIHNSGAVVERVESFKFFLSWAKQTNTIMKSAQQHLFPLRRLKRLGMQHQKLNICTIESIFTGCITTCYLVQVCYQKAPGKLLLQIHKSAE